MRTLNSMGDKMPPCLTPLVTRKGVVVNGPYKKSCGAPFHMHFLMGIQKSSNFNKECGETFIK